MTRPRKPLPTLEELFRRTVIVGDCWEWQGSTSGAGRPSVRVGPQVLYVARVVLMLTLGRKLKRGMVAAHSCDNARCIRPDHLAEENYTSNLRASYARKRRACRPKTLVED